MQNQYGISQDFWGILNGVNTVSIRQHVKYLPKTCCTCPPCVKQENTYSVYAGASRDAQREFLRIDEVSDDWNRCCCAPYHPLRLEARSYVPPPGFSAAGVAQSDWQNLYGDVSRDWGSWGWQKRAEYYRDFYKNQPVHFNILRDDGQRCCCKCPCKCLSTHVCFSFCQDGAHVYAGPLADEPDKERGRPWNLNPANLMGSVIQPCGGGWYRPNLEVRDGDDSRAPFGIIEGPCFFGGWSELCCDFKFFTSKPGSDKPGDVAIITKQKPQSMAGVFQELDGANADNYMIEFNPEANLTVNQKATLIAGQILVDYMFFDGNTEKCVVNDDGVTCYFCYCLVIGALVPCYLHIPNNKGG